MAISLGDALGISEVRLPGQSVAAFNLMMSRNVRAEFIY